MKAEKTPWWAWMVIGLCLLGLGIVGEMDRRDALRARQGWAPEPVAAVYGLHCEMELYGSRGHQ